MDRSRDPSMATVFPLCTATGTHYRRNCRETAAHQLLPWSGSVQAPGETEGLKTECTGGLHSHRYKVETWVQVSIIGYLDLLRLCHYSPSFRCCTCQMWGCQRARTQCIPDQDYPCFQSTREIDAFRTLPIWVADPGRYSSQEGMWTEGNKKWWMISFAAWCHVSMMYVPCSVCN